MMAIGANSGIGETTSLCAHAATIRRQRRREDGVVNRRCRSDATRYVPMEDPQNGWRKGQCSLTEAEKMVIRAARKADWNYRQIARLIERSREMVRRYCRREDIAIDLDPSVQRTAEMRGAQNRKPLSICEWCGREYRPRSDARTPCCCKVCAGAWRSWKSKGPIFCTYGKCGEPGICIDCGELFQRTRYGQLRRCPKCRQKYLRRKWQKHYRENAEKCRIIAARWRAKHPELIKPKPYTIVCPECGRTKQLTEKQYQLGYRYCSDRCSRKAQMRSYEMRRRGAFVEDVHRQVLYERDHGRCQICGRKVHRRWTGAYDPLYWTIDHIVALSNGGAHSYDNTQLACHECNTKKGASQEWSQLLLA